MTFNAIKKKINAVCLISYFASMSTLLCSYTQPGETHTFHVLFFYFCSGVALFSLNDRLGCISIARCLSHTFDERNHVDIIFVYFSLNISKKKMCKNETYFTVRLREICDEYHRRWYDLEDGEFDLQYLVARKDLEARQFLFYRNIFFLSNLHSLYSYQVLTHRATFCID